MLGSQITFLLSRPVIKLFVCWIFCFWPCYQTFWRSGAAFDHVFRCYVHNQLITCSTFWLIFLLNKPTDGTGPSSSFRNATSRNQSIHYVIFSKLNEMHFVICFCSNCTSCDAPFSLCCSISCVLKIRKNAIAIIFSIRLCSLHKVQYRRVQCTRQEMNIGPMFRKMFSKNQHGCVTALWTIF